VKTIVLFNIGYQNNHNITLRRTWLYRLG